MINPPDYHVRVQDAAGISLDIKLKWNNPAGRLDANLIRAQKFVDSETLRLSAPYMPLQTGNLINSGIRGTVIGSGLVMWNAVYAHKQYHQTARSRPYDANRGSHWVDRMKIDHLDEIVDGANAVLGGRL